MSSYTNIFGGENVQTADTSYLAIALNQNTVLSWPTEFQNVNEDVCYRMDVTPDAADRSLTLPDATNVSVGTAFVVTNPGAFAFNLLVNTGDLLDNIGAGTSSEFYLIDNTTVAGTWRNIPRGGGVPAVTSVNAAIPDATDNQNLQVAGGPIINAGTLNFSLGGDLRALTRFGGNVGISVRTAADTWALRQITPAPNANIAIQNPAGTAGNIIIDVTQTIGVAPQNAITEIRVGNIDIQANTISSQSVNGNIILQPNGTGETNTPNNLSIRGGSLLKFFNTDNSHFISLSGSAIPAGGPGFDLNLVFPAAMPAVGQVLQYTGGAPNNLGWATVANFSGIASTDQAIARYSGVGGTLQNSGVIIDNTNNVTTAGSVTANTSFISGNIFLASALNTLGTTANNLNISPTGGSSVIVNSNLYIGTTAATRSLLFAQSNGFTVSFSPPPVMAGNVAFVVPNSPGAQTSLLQSTDGTGALSFTDLVGGTGTSGTTATAIVTRNAASTINPVVPGSMVAHDGVTKAWAMFVGATAAISASYNINAIVRNSAGNYTITFNANMASVNYCVIVTRGNIGYIYVDTLAAATFRILAFNTDGVTAGDPNFICFSCYGRQF